MNVKTYITIKPVNDEKEKELCEAVSDREFHFDIEKDSCSILKK